MAFDEDGAPVLSTDFAYPEESEVTTAAAPAAMEVLRLCIITVIEAGRRDGVAIRAAALARLLGLYGSDAEIAAKMGVEASTLAHAKQKLSAKVNGALSKIHVAKSRIAR